MPYVFLIAPLAARLSLAVTLPWLIAGVAVGAAVLVVAWMAQRVREAEARLQNADQKVRLGLVRSERDRACLAKTLHDGPVQDLLALGLEARLQAHLGLPEQPSDVTAVVRQLRDVSEGLHPPALVPFGLGAAITAYADRFSATHPNIAVSLDLDDDALPSQTRLALFRIIQEAVGNAARHGPPRQIAICLQTFDAGVALTIRDDGPGWEIPDDIATLTQEGRYGVFGMLMQAESVGGTLALQSVPGETVVHATAPPLLPNWA